MPIRTLEQHCTSLYIVACHLHHVPSADRHFSTVVFVGLRLAVVYDVVHAAIKHILWLLYIDYSGAPLNLTPLGQNKE